MGKRSMGAVWLCSGLALVVAACGSDADEVEESARQAASSIADQAKQAATTVADEAKETASSVAGGAEGASRLKATLTGAEEVPGPGDPDGRGTATVNLDVSKREACYEVSTQKVEKPSAMHLHEGEKGKAGPVVVTLSTPSGGDTTTKGCADVDAALVGRILATPGNFYVNVHSEAHKDGAVRGQLSQ